MTRMHTAMDRIYPRFLQPLLAPLLSMGDVAKLRQLLKAGANSRLKTELGLDVVEYSKL